VVLEQLRSKTSLKMDPTTKRSAIDQQITANGSLGRQIRPLPPFEVPNLIETVRRQDERDRLEHEEYQASGPGM
jgi:hypothetical protein